MNEEENRFFKWLWRINAIGFFLVLCAGIYSLVEEQIRRSYRMDSPPEPITSIAEDPKGVEKWVLRTQRQMIDSSYMMLSLVSEYSKVKAKDKAYYYSTNNVAYYHDNIAKNLLFINRENSHASWLFHSNNQLIVQHQLLIPYSIRLNNKKEPKAKLVYYKVIDRDTNGDKIVTMEDKQSFAVSKASGEGYKIIVRDIESIISIEQNKKGEMYLVYQKEGMGYVLRLNVETLKVMDDVMLPKVEGK